MGFFSAIITFICDLFGIETKEEKKEKQEVKDSEQEPTSDEVKKKKEEKWKNANNPFKFVITKGKVQCKFCSNPIGDFTANDKGVHLQDEDWATTEDCDSKVNFAFLGTCNHPSQQKPFSPPPPCKTVINLGKWKDFSLGTKINDESPLLMKSTIPCLISGQDLIITDSGQRTTIAVIEPMMERKIKIIKSFWVDESLSYKLEHIAFEDIAYLYIKTVDYEPNEIIRIPLQYEQKKSELIGKIDEQGEALIKWEKPK